MTAQRLQTRYLENKTRQVYVCDKTFNIVPCDHKRGNITWLYWNEYMKDHIFELRRNCVTATINHNWNSYHMVTLPSTNNFFLTFICLISLSVLIFLMHYLSSVTFHCKTNTISTVHVSNMLQSIPQQSNRFKRANCYKAHRQMLWNCK